jgi:hypothetical protein
MLLIITVNVEITFRDSLTVIGAAVMANDPGFQDVATKINEALLSTPSRAPQILSETVSTFMWTGQQKQWMADYESKMQAAWGRKYTFASTHPGWEGQLARVDVVVNTSRSTTTGRRRTRRAARLPSRFIRGRPFSRAARCHSAQAIPERKSLGAAWMSGPIRS